VIDTWHRGLWPSGRGKVSLPLSPGFESQCTCLSLPRCLTCLLGLQGIQWVRGLVVVRVSWPGHPGLPKKKVIDTWPTTQYYTDPTEPTTLRSTQYVFWFFLECYNGKNVIKMIMKSMCIWGLVCMSIKF